MVGTEDSKLSQDRLRSVLRGLLAAALALVVAVPAVAALSACGGPNPQDQVKQGLNSQLDTIKNDPQTVLATASKSDLSQFEDYGVDPEEFYKSLMAHFTFSLGNVEMGADGTTAKVMVDSQNVDFAQVTTAVQQELTQWATTSEAQELAITEGQKGIISHVFDVFMEAFSSPDAPLTESSVEVEMEKQSDGSWDLADDDDIQTIVFAGQDADVITDSLS